MTLDRKLRVLIADDVHETRRNTRVMLSMIDGVEVVAIAMNGLQAVEMATLTQPDVVVLDINMPELNGLAAYKRISQANPNIACIIISAEKDAGTLRAAKSIGIQNYLIKPFSTNELEAAVKEVRTRLETGQQNTTQIDHSYEKNMAQLKKLAEEYTKAKRTDDQAIEVFEELTQSPDCDMRHVQNLAIIYVVRQKWDRLKMLAEKIEQKTK